MSAALLHRLRAVRTLRYWKPVQTGIEQDDDTAEVLRLSGFAQARALDEGWRLPRPLSPHLSIWKWGAAMLVSILHRVTGGALTVAGLGILTWWLAALASGKDDYATFLTAANHPVGMIVLVGLTWAFWQHLFSGLRHLVLDMGAGYELKVNRFWSVMTLAGSLTATVVTWAVLMGVIG